MGGGSIKIFCHPASQFANNKRTPSLVTEDVTGYAPRTGHIDNTNLVKRQR